MNASANKKELEVIEGKELETKLERYIGKLSWIGIGFSFLLLLTLGEKFIIVAILALLIMFCCLALTTSKRKLVKAFVIESVAEKKNPNFDRCFHYCCPIAYGLEFAYYGIEKGTSLLYVITTDTYDIRIINLKNIAKSELLFDEKIIQTINQGEKLPPENLFVRIYEQYTNSKLESESETLPTAMKTLSEGSIRLYDTTLNREALTFSKAGFFISLTDFKNSLERSIVLFYAVIYNCMKDSRPEEIAETAAISNMSTHNDTLCMNQNTEGQDSDNHQENDNPAETLLSNDTIEIFMEEHLAATPKHMVTNLWLWVAVLSPLALAMILLLLMLTLGTFRFYILLDKTWFLWVAISAIVYNLPDYFDKAILKNAGYLSQLAPLEEAINKNPISMFGSNTPPSDSYWYLRAKLLGRNTITEYWIPLAVKMLCLCPICGYYLISLLEYFGIF